MSTNKNGLATSRRTIIKSTSIISLGTLSSRVLGFLRDIILAHMLGTGIKADTFFVALRIPNLFRDIVGEGAANSAIVPVFSEYVEKNDKRQLNQFVSVLFVVSLMLLSMIVVVGILFSPMIIRVMAPGFWEDRQKFDLAVSLTRFMFPYLIFIGLTAYSTGILYTFRSFIVPAFSPCLLNVAFIISALVSMNMEEPVYGLAAGVLAGGIAQLLVQIKPLLKNGISFEKPIFLNHPGVKKVGKLLLPRLFGSGIYQLNVLVDTFCASLSSIVGTGGIAAIYYANRIVQLPLGVFVAALASVMLPTLSGLSTQSNMEQFKKSVMFSVKGTALVLLPFSIVLLSLSEPIIRVIFERGEFTGYSTHITSLALSFYSIGLISFGGSRILVTAFHALQDTTTPVKAGALSLLVSIILNFLLIKPFKVGGIALASAASATVNFIVLYFWLNQRLGGLHENMGRFVLKVFFSAILMGLSVVLVWKYGTMFPEMLRLILAGTFGFIAFTVACFLLKVDQMKDVFQWMLRKK